MAHEPEDELLSSDELHEALDPDDDALAPVLPAEPIDDALLESPTHVPLLDRFDEQPVSAHAPSRGLVRALWFLGTIVTLLLVVQVTQLVLPRDPPIIVRAPAPEKAPPAPAPAPAPAAPAVVSLEEIDRTLREMRVRLSRGLYEDVLRLLEPLAEHPTALDPNQRFEARLLLARACRALGNVEKAQRYQMLATDQMIERREPAQVLEHASTLAEGKRPADARIELMKLLARRDGLAARDAPWLSLAEARVADAWYSQAKDSGHLPPLPGASRGAEKVRIPGPDDEDGK
jgi:hypothetical protein